MVMMGGIMEGSNRKDGHGMGIYMVLATEL
jgi:hypothetical protein